MFGGITKALFDLNVLVFTTRVTGKAAVGLAAMTVLCVSLVSTVSAQQGQEPAPAEIQLIPGNPTLGRLTVAVRPGAGTLALEGLIGTIFASGAWDREASATASWANAAGAPGSWVDTERESGTWTVSAGSSATWETTAGAGTTWRT